MRFQERFFLLVAIMLLYNVLRAQVDYQETARRFLAEGNCVGARGFYDLALENQLHGQRDYDLERQIVDCEWGVISDEQQPVAVYYFRKHSYSIGDARRLNNEADEALKALRDISSIKGFRLRGWVVLEDDDDNREHAVTIAENRMNAVENHIYRLFRNRQNDIKIISEVFGVDLNMCIEAVKASSIRDKDHIIKMLLESSNTEEILLQLVDIYPQFEYFYPELRRVEVYAIR